MRLALVLLALLAADVARAQTWYATADTVGPGNPECPGYPAGLAMPLPIDRIEPESIALPRGRPIPARITAAVWVGSGGDVRGVRVLRYTVAQNADAGAPARLATSAISALRQWRFQPASRDGNPVDTWVTVPIRFQYGTDQGPQVTLRYAGVCGEPPAVNTLPRSVANSAPSVQSFDVEGPIYCASRELLLHNTMKWIQMGDSVRVIDPDTGSKTLVVTRTGVRDIVWTDGLTGCEVYARADSIARAEEHRRQVRAAAQAVTEQAQAAVAQAEARRLATLPVVVIGPSVEVDFVGGVEVAIGLRNQSRKIIRYAYFTFIPYNAVGDAQRSSIGGTSTVRASFTGPLEAGEETNVTWRALWYNSTISCVRLTHIEVQYMDGTSRTFSPATPYTYNPTGNRCTYEAQRNPRF